MYNLSATPLRVFFFGLVAFIDARFSIKRLGNILAYPDEDQNENLQYNSEDCLKGEILIKDFTGGYDDFALKRMT